MKDSNIEQINDGDDDDDDDDVAYDNDIKPPSWKNVKFENVKILLAKWVQRDEEHHIARFYQNRSTRCRDIAFFSIFSRWAVRHFGFVLDLLKTHEEYLLVFIILQNLVAIDALVSII